MKRAGAASAEAPRVSPSSRQADAPKDSQGRQEPWVPDCGAETARCAVFATIYATQRATVMPPARVFPGLLVRVSRCLRVGPGVSSCLLLGHIAGYTSRGAYGRFSLVDSPGGKVPAARPGRPSQHDA